MRPTVKASASHISHPRPFFSSVVFPHFERCGSKRTTANAGVKTSKHPLFTAVYHTVGFFFSPAAFPHLERCGSRACVSLRKTVRSWWRFPNFRDVWWMARPIRKHLPTRNKSSANGSKPHPRLEERSPRLAGGPKRMSRHRMAFGCFASSRRTGSQWRIDLWGTE
jgi:hypothetical protein